MNICTPFFRFLLAISCLFISKNALQACGYNFTGGCSSLVNLSINGTVDSFSIDPCGIGIPFNGLNFGEIGSLDITQITTTTWESCVNNVTNVQFYYKVYPVGGTGTWVFVDLPTYHVKVEGPYTTRSRGLFNNMDLTSGLTPGTDYVFELYYRAEVDTIGDDFIPETEIFLNNSGSNYKVYFKYGGASAPPFTVVKTKLVNPTCAGGSDGIVGVFVYGDQSGLFYNWGFPYNFYILWQKPAGTYTVTVTGASGYSQTVSMVLTDPPPLIIQVLQNTPVGCGSGGLLEVATTAGQAPYSYLWNTGEQTPTLQVAQPGLWTVTATDNKGCTAAETITVEGETMDSTLTQAKICPGQIYDFYGQALNQSGIYYHTLNLDGMGCDSIAVLSLEVTNLEAALSDIPSFVTLDCHVPTLEVCAAVVPNSSIVWSFEDFVVGTENCQTIQWEGQYTVLIESGSCFALKQVLVVDETDNLQGAGNVYFYQSCDTAFLTVLQGSSNLPGVQFSWGVGSIILSNKDLDSLYLSDIADLEGLQLHITDENGCQLAIDPVVTIFPVGDVPLIQNSSLQTPNCDGTTSGELTLSGGLPPYALQWSIAGQDTPNYTLPPGDYSVTVTDAHACQNYLNFTIAPFDTLEIALIPSVQGSIQVQANLPLESFVWSNGGTSNPLNGLSPGAYCVTVTAINGCTAQSCTVLDSVVAVYSLWDPFNVHLLSNLLSVGEPMTFVNAEGLVGQSFLLQIIASDGRLVNELRGTGFEIDKIAPQITEKGVYWANLIVGRKQLAFKLVVI